MKLELLEKDVLRGDEPKILYDNHLIAPKLDTTAKKELGEGSGSARYDATAGETLGT